MNIKQWQSYLTEHGIKPAIAERIAKDTINWRKEKALSTLARR